MESKNPNKKHHLFIIVFLSLVIIAVISLIFLGFSRRISALMLENTFYSLNEIAAQNRDIFAMQLRREQEILRITAKMLTASGGGVSDNTEKIIQILQVSAGNSRFSSVMYCDKEGNVLSNFGEKNFAGDQEYFLQSIAGNEFITQPFVSRISGEKIMVLSCPVFVGRTVVGTVQGAFYLGDLNSFFIENEYRPDSYAFIVDTSGAVVLQSNHEALLIDVEKALDFAQKVDFDGDFSTEKLLESLKNNKTGSYGFTYNGFHRYVSFIPVGINGWYSFTSTTGKLAAQSFDFIHSLMFNTAEKLLIIVVIVFVLILLYRRNKEKQIALLNSQLMEEIASAYIDSVTGRSTFAKFKIVATDILTINPEKKYAIFFSDIKKFKYINDAYGFEAGNRILRYYSDRLASSGKLAFARVSSDNFVSIEEYVDSNSVYNSCLERIVVINDVRGVIEGLSSITVHVGVYCTEGENKLSIDAMIDRAMIAQRQLKQAQTGGCMLYRESFRQEMITNQRMENRMDNALKNGEFEVYLQPKIDTVKNEIVSCEALCRWLAPEEGIISPARFIPLFERNGFIKKLDEYMFRQICILLRDWIDSGKKIIPISVNVSRVLLSSPVFLNQYLELKREYNIPDGLIEVEFTESVLFDDSERMNTILSFFKENGILCAIDDFGSGYSSLNLLKTLPAGVLKLDRLFFIEDSHMEREHIILKNIIIMARELSMLVVAEGVERIEQVEFLKSVGCTIVQGYVFDKPLPVREFERKYSMNMQGSSGYE